VVGHDETLRLGDHPVCGVKVGCAVFFLMPQPPLLYQERSCQRPTLLSTPEARDYKLQKSDHIT
jgi:hypothetical protein